MLVKVTTPEGTVEVEGSTPTANTTPASVVIQAASVSATKEHFEIHPVWVQKLADEPGSKWHSFISVVLEPCTKSATKDTQDDWYGPQDIEEAFDTYCRKQGVGAYHTNPDAVGIELRDNFLVRKELFGGDITLAGRVVKVGSWVQNQAINEDLNPAVWAAVQKGDLAAFSSEGIGCRDEVGDETEAA